MHLLPVDERELGLDRCERLIRRQQRRFWVTTGRSRRCVSAPGHRPARARRIGLSVYDLERREPVLIEDLGENRNEGSREAVVDRPHINGGLLAYIQGSGDPSVELVLKYVELPLSPDARGAASARRPRIASSRAIALVCSVGSAWL